MYYFVCKTSLVPAIKRFDDDDFLEAMEYLMNQPENNSNYVVFENRNLYTSIYYKHNGKLYKFTNNKETLVNLQFKEGLNESVLNKIRKLDNLDSDDDSTSVFSDCLSNANIMHNLKKNESDDLSAYSLSSDNVSGNESEMNKLVEVIKGAVKEKQEKNSNKEIVNLLKEFAKYCETQK